MDANSMMSTLAQNKPAVYHDIMSKLLRAVDSLSISSDAKAPTKAAKSAAVTASVAAPVAKPAPVKTVSAEIFRAQGWPETIQGLKMSKVHYAVSKVTGSDGKAHMTPVPVYGSNDVFVKFASAVDTGKGGKVTGVSLRTM
jgi:hypothetical protein